MLPPSPSSPASLCLSLLFVPPRFRSMHACREASRGYSLHLRSWRIAEGALGATFADVEREPHQRGGGLLTSLIPPPLAP